MRHRKAIPKLGRTASHRKATLANLAIALFERKHIQTTEAKAKATQRVAEKLITLAKNNTVHARRIALKRLHNKKILNVLFGKGEEKGIADFYADRPGGYTRVIKLGQRQGDGASMAVLELVGYETASKKKKAKDKEKEAKSETKKKKKKSKVEDGEVSADETRPELIEKKTSKKKPKDEEEKKSDGDEREGDKKEKAKAKKKK